MNPDRSEGVRNDLLRIVEQYRKEYPEGAASLEAVVGALVECEDLPSEIILNSDVDSVPLSQRKLDDENVIRYPEFVHNRDSGVVEMKNGDVSELVFQENEILNLLASRPLHYFTSEEISNHLVGYSDRSSNNSIRTVVSRLRKKIPLYDEKGDHRIIRSRVKFGYMFDPFLESESELKEQVIERVEIEVPIVKREVTVIKGPNIILIPEDLTIQSGEKIAKLTALEADMIKLLMTSSTVVTYAQLCPLLDGRRYLDLAPSPDAVRTNMSRIRGKLKKIGISRDLIKNVRSVGFYLDLPKDEEGSN